MTQTCRGGNVSETVTNQLVPSERILVEHLKKEEEYVVLLFILTFFYSGHHPDSSGHDHHDVKGDHLHPELWPTLESASGVMQVNLSAGFSFLNHFLMCGLK